jgi:hypothetical protein
MKNKLLLVLALLSFNAYAEVDLLNETKAVVAPLPTKLKSVLIEQIRINGLVGGIETCSKIAPKAMQDISNKTGWEVKRVSLKNRNPNGQPDLWEMQALKEFEELAKKDENSELEKWEIIQDENNSYFRYIKGLKTTYECLMCHSSKDNLSNDVKNKLKELYPNDLATGYSTKQVRGGISVIREISNIR